MAYMLGAGSEINANAAARAQAQNAARDAGGAGIAANVYLKKKELAQQLGLAHDQMDFQAGQAQANRSAQSDELAAKLGLSRDQMNQQHGEFGQTMDARSQELAQKLGLDTAHENRLHDEFGQTMGAQDAFRKTLADQWGQDFGLRKTAADQANEDRNNDPNRMINNYFSSKLRGAMAPGASQPPALPMSDGGGNKYQGVAGIPGPINPDSTGHDFSAPQLDSAYGDQAGKIFKPMDASSVYGVAGAPASGQPPIKMNPGVWDLPPQLGDTGGADLGASQPAFNPTSADLNAGPHGPIGAGLPTTIAQAYGIDQQSQKPPDIMDLIEAYRGGQTSADKAAARADKMRLNAHQDKQWAREEADQARKDRGELSPQDLTKLNNDAMMEVTTGMERGLAEHKDPVQLAAYLTNAANAKYGNTPGFKRMDPKQFGVMGNEQPQTVANTPQLLGEKLSGTPGVNTDDYLNAQTQKFLAMHNENQAASNPGMIEGWAAQKAAEILQNPSPGPLERLAKTAARWMAPKTGQQSTDPESANQLRHFISPADARQHAPQALADFISKHGAKQLSPAENALLSQILSQRL